MYHKKIVEISGRQVVVHHNSSDFGVREEDGQLKLSAIFADGCDRWRSNALFDLSEIKEGEEVYVMEGQWNLPKGIKNPRGITTLATFGHYTIIATSRKEVEAGTPRSTRYEFGGHDFRTGSYGSYVRLAQA